MFACMECMCKRQAYIALSLCLPFLYRLPAQGKNRRVQFFQSFSIFFNFNKLITPIQLIQFVLLQHRSVSKRFYIFILNYMVRFIAQSKEQVQYVIIIRVFFYVETSRDFVNIIFPVSTIVIEIFCSSLYHRQCSTIEFR